VGEIAKMKAEGKIRHVGVSNVTLSVKAQKIIALS